MTKIACQACRGNGERDLAPWYERTLAMLKRAVRTSVNAWASTREIGGLMPGVKRSLLSNRLAYLEHAGLVESRKLESDPRQLEWRAL